MDRIDPGNKKEEERKRERNEKKEGQRKQKEGFAMLNQMNVRIFR